MEILSSTDVIGEEIKEEARKKANLILKNADAEVAKLQALAGERLARLKEMQEQLYSEKIKKYRDEVFVRLPLSKFKEKIEYVENLFNLASTKYFASLDVNSQLFIVKTVLKKYKSVLQEGDILVKYAGFPKEKVARLVSSVFPACNIKEVREATNEEMRRFAIRQGIIIEEVEKNFFCKASLEGAKTALFDEMKARLCDVLCGVGEDVRRN